MADYFWLSASHWAVVESHIPKVSPASDGW
jgi:hypothetical protein